MIALKVSPSIPSLTRMSLLRTAIGAVLRRLRLRQGRTLRDVADEAGVSMPYLSEIERGRKEASSEILAGVCRALGIGLPELLEEVRLELLRSPVSQPVAGTAQFRTALNRSALSRSAVGRDRGRSGFRTPRLAVCRTLSPTVSSSSTNF
jgi:transcriptional regulator with XRE-family HTH domain